jgi:hypothetical protein
MGVGQYETTMRPEKRKDYDPLHSIYSVLNDAELGK